MSLRLPILAGLLLCLSLASCSRPLRSETFVRNDGSGSYFFDVDMSDSLCTYSLSFFCPRPLRKAPAGFPVKVYLTSPGGERYGESLYFDASGAATVPYRRGLRPVEYGCWRLELMLDAPRLYGMGLIVEKEY